jgi:hypothetical protein
MQRLKGTNLGNDTFVLVSINPDWVDEMGHHAQFDRTLREQVQAVGGEFISLTSVDIDSNDSWQRPTFTDRTFDIELTASADEEWGFQQELESGLNAILNEYASTPVLAAMYSGSVAHLPAVLETATAIASERLSIFVNLLRAHEHLTQANAGTVPALARVMLRTVVGAGEHAGVHVLADTDSLVSVIEQETGVTVPRWPMFAVSTFDGDPAGSTGETKQHEHLTLCYPGTQKIKGLADFAAFAADARRKDALGSVVLTARDTGNQPAIITAMKANGVQVVAGTLTPHEYTAWLRSADIVALPYHTDPFDMRTSGAFADAMVLGIPVVATRSTWAGRIVKDHDLGMTFEQGDVAGFLEAAEIVVADYAAYRDRIRAFAPRWLETNSPGAVVDTLTALATTAPRDYQRASVAVEALAELQLVAREAARSLDADLDRFNERITTRNTEITQLTTNLNKANERITTRNTEIPQLTTNLNKSNERITTIDTEIAQLKTDLNEALRRATSSRRQAADDRLRSRQMIEELEGTIEALERTFGNRSWAALKRRLPGSR